MSIALNLYYNFVKKKPQVKIWVAMSDVGNTQINTNTCYYETLITQYNVTYPCPGCPSCPGDPGDPPPPQHPQPQHPQPQ